MNHGSSSFDPSVGDQARRSQTGPLAEGTLFTGRYRVVRCIASGGMGSVYEVIHTETERRRALKVMLPHLFQSDEMRERFKREARIAAQVESEYIVDVSDAGVDQATGTPFLVMELLQGEELGARLKRLGRLPPTEAMTYLYQMALALDRTHSKRIVHRDLKPENIFLTLREDGSPRIKILDFGVAKVVAEGATGAGATRSLGTPLYMAPEQFRAGVPLQPSADIYALGMMAYTLLVGEPYWAPEARISGDVIAFAMLAVQGPPESAVARAAARRVALPAAFDGWFACVTARNPGERFSKASEAMRALGEVLGVRSDTGSGLQVGSGPVGAGSSRVGPEPASFDAGAAQPGAFGRASTSTGAAVGPSPEHGPRSRGPIVAGIALVSVGVLGLSAWFAIRHLPAMSGGNPGLAGSGATTSASAERPETTATTEPLPGGTALSTTAPEVTPARTPLQSPPPPLTGTLPGKKPKNEPSAGPTSASTTAKPPAQGKSTTPPPPTAKPTSTLIRD